MEQLKQCILQHLRYKHFFDLTVTEQVDSTNRLVKEWGQEGKKEGCVLLATEQTNGRGRLGRSFYSPKGTGVYFSVLLRPHLPPEKSLLITTAAAVAVAKAIGENAQIKWVNDVYVKGKKVCGILTESAFSGEKIDYAVLGIGLNLAPPKEGFPEEIQDIAGSVFDLSPAVEQVALLVATILNEFFEAYENLSSPLLVEEYAKRNILQGQIVTAGDITGVVQGITPAFGLILKDQEGTTHVLQAGEVTIGSKRFDLSPSLC
jgi:BirA family biotin operon repressor/biotin-[acetyl-CoA-carboxylase] ligase